MFERPRPVRNLSVSKIEKAMLCPKHYRLKFLDKIPEPASWVAHGGIVVHEIVEGALKTFARKGIYPNWQDLDDQFDVTWNHQQLKTEGKDDFIGWKEDPQEPYEKVKAECRPLVRLAREEALPSYRPMILESGPVVEHRIDLELDSPIGPFPLIGYIDLLDEAGILADWKTTGVNKEGKVSDRKMKSWFQSAAYSIWGWPIVGDEELQCQKIFLVKGPEPRIEISRFKVGPKHRGFFIEQAAQCWVMTMNGGFVANPNTWMCNPKYCFAYEICRGEIDDAGYDAHEDLI